MRIRWGRIVLGTIAVVGVAALCIAVTLVSGLWLGRPGSSVDVSPQVSGTPPRTAVTPATASRPTSPGSATSETGTAASPVPGDLPTFDVLTLQYTPYMATLALMDARGYMEAQGYDLQLHDVYSPEIDLTEEGQCGAMKSGAYDALATTVDATRKCGSGVAVGIPIGQSAGNDAIVVKPGVDTWNEVFQHAIAFTGYSVSEYMACFASHTANEPIRVPFRYDDASAAVDAWINSGPEQDILSVVAWEPEISRALDNVEGASVLLSSKDVRILWDIVEFPTAGLQADPNAYAAFTKAYYMALRDLTRDPSGALAAIVAWAGDDEGRQALLTTTDADEFTSDLGNEAFATVRDAGFLMENRDTLRNRLEEAAFYWQYCDVDIPAVDDLDTLIAPDPVLAARDDSTLLLSPGERPSDEVFQVTDFTDASAVTDAQIEQAKVIFETGIDIEFQANRTDFRDPAAANQLLANAVRFLRTCQECVLQVQGGAAYPGEAVCPVCKPEDSDTLAVQRGKRVYDELRLRFDVPEAQLRFVEAPHKPQYAGSNNEEELRLDRRTFLKGLQLTGR